MTDTAAKESDLDIIEGSNNILLIAPHGVEESPLDDLNTADLTRKIAKTLNCSAIINHIYWKPYDTEKEKRNGGKPDLENMYLDLNSFDQAKLHPDFITAIENIVKDKNQTTVIWIHGADDANLKKEAKRFKGFKQSPEKLRALIGYGQGPDRSVEVMKRTKAEKEDSTTIKKELAEKFAKLLTDNGIATELTSSSAKNFCGRASDNMNQWFVNRGNEEQVQSIQLELGLSGVRIKEKLGSSAKNISYAIASLLNIDLQATEEENPKVEKAYQHLKNIFIKYISKAMLEAGQYLIELFYDGNYQLAEDKPFTHSKSLTQLFDKLKTETSGNAPKKTWLYDSINLAIAEKKYNEVSVYGKLGNSHKIKLIGQKNFSRKTKIELMEKTVDKEWTVLQLQEEINELKKTDDIKLDEPIPIVRLMALEFQKLNSLRTRTVERKDKVLEELALYQENLKKIEKALIHKPQIISVSRRTDIPAFYSDWFFNRVKKGFVQVRKDLEKKLEYVSLKPENVRCFVFWTKNPGPMLNRLDDLKDYHYYFHFTLTPYGKDLEKKLPPKDKLVETFIQLSQKKIGQEKVKVIWRYDPIVLNDEIDIDYHKREFEKLAKSLQGHTDRCVINFAKISKTDREALKLKPTPKKVKVEIAKELYQLGQKYGIEIETCRNKIDVPGMKINPTKCIDDKLIGTIIGVKLDIDKDPSLRSKACGCVESIDIGTDNTCTYGCVFCYATEDLKKAISNYRQHDKNSPLLIGKMEDAVKEKA